jgi:hypothetical protein
MKGKIVTDKCFENLRNLKYSTPYMEVKDSLLRSQDPVTLL